jgi:transposase
MFGFGAATRIYVVTGAIDMRKGFNGLYGIVRNRFAMGPESGHLFLFSNAKRDRMKVLFFDLC